MLQTPKPLGMASSTCILGPEDTGPVTHRSANVLKNRKVSGFSRTPYALKQRRCYVGKQIPEIRGQS